MLKEMVYLQVVVLALFDFKDFGMSENGLQRTTIIAKNKVTRERIAKCLNPVKIDQNNRLDGMGFLLFVRTTKRK